MRVKEPRILECTLRDGSYAIDYQFSAQDCSDLCTALESVGFDLIEIGHGVGLGGSSIKNGQAAATDEQYCEAAAKALKKSKFGAFFIPGIGTKEHLDMARGYGMSFIRIGTNVTQVEEAKPFIEYAKKLGFNVSYNAMKSYVLDPADFAQQMRKTWQWGADSVYLVDSSGGMTPDEVRVYMRQMRGAVECDMGFHGHNNFMLANANNLAALDEGAMLVDATLQGMGRSSGNAQTEIMAILLQKRGFAKNIDVMRCLEIGEKMIRPRMQAGGVTALEVVIAMAQFHSSFQARAERVATKTGVDLKNLIIAVSKVDKINPSEELMIRIATEIE
jgi:4-hydroxy 2-oxovalerate aldolase